MIDGTKDVFDENGEQKNENMRPDMNNVIEYIFPAGYDSAIGRRAHRMSRRNGAFYGKEAKTVSVDADKIHPCQPFVNAAKVVALFYCLKRHENLNGYPTGLLLGEDFYLLDGHHRVSAQLMYGMKKIEVLATEITQEDWDEAEIRMTIVTPKSETEEPVIMNRRSKDLKILREKFNGNVRDFIMAKYNNEI